MMPATIRAGSELKQKRPTSLAAEEGYTVITSKIGGLLLLKKIDI